MSLQAGVMQQQQSRYILLASKVRIISSAPSSCKGSWEIEFWTFEASTGEPGLEKCGQELVSSEPAWNISHSTD